MMIHFKNCKTVTKLVYLKIVLWPHFSTDFHNCFNKLKVILSQF